MYTKYLDQSILASGLQAFGFQISDFDDEMFFGVMLRLQTCFCFARTLRPRVPLLPEGIARPMRWELPSRPALGGLCVLVAEYGEILSDG